MNRTAFFISDGTGITAETLGKLKPARYTLEWRGSAVDGLAALLGDRWDACLLDYHIGDESVVREALSVARESIGK